MKIIIAPDSFKECLSAERVAQALERGLRRKIPHADYRRLPLADGGEGTTAALVAATDGRIRRQRVMGPLGRPAQGLIGVTGDGCTAILEMASASGLPLVPTEHRDPRLTTTYGTGELIRYAVQMKVRKIIIGIGGSATNDGGAGMAQALGVRFYDSRMKLISPP
ncbi:MAG: glycerate kinase, partial [Gammaproteobacteria bacterium]